MRMSFWRSTMRRLKTDIRSSNVTSPPPLVSIPPPPPPPLLPQFLSLSLLIQTGVEKAALLDFFATTVFLCPNRQARANPRSPKSSCSLFFLSSSPPVCLPRCVADLLPPYPPPLPRSASAPLHAAVSCGKSVCYLSICSRFRCG
jgi:hypothetical protein